MNALTTARLALEDLLGRFEAFLADTPATLDTCRALAEAVRFGELRRHISGSPFDTSAFQESDGESKVIGVRDRWTGQVVGCVRGTFVRSVMHLPAVRREYHLDSLPPELAARAAIAARMVVAPSHRKTAASLVLMRALYRVGLEDQLEIFAVSCEPALLSLYQRMGYRPVGPVWAKPDGGFRVPVFMAGYDAAHLARVRSPLLPVLQAHLKQPNEPRPNAATLWLSAHGIHPGAVGVRPWPPATRSSALDPLTQGLSPAATAGLLTRAVEVTTRPGDLVFREGDGVRSLIVVLEGAVEAHRDGVTHHLPAGSVVGLTSVITDCDRHASVVAVEPGRLLLLSRTALDRVRAPADRALLWQHLARLAAQRSIPHRVAPG